MRHSSPMMFAAIALLCASCSAQPEANYRQACADVLASDYGLDQCTAGMMRTYKGPADAQRQRNAAAQISRDLDYPLKAGV